MESILVDPVDLFIYFRDMCDRYAPLALLIPEPPVIGGCDALLLPLVLLLPWWSFVMSSLII